MDLSIIIVNWNSEAYLRECLASVFEYTHGIDYEIIVVDNASPNKNVDTLSEEFPSIRVIKSAQNLGFSAANNLGFRSSSGRVVLFLNPDTLLMDPAITTLLANLDNLPDAGVVGGRLLNTDLSVQTSCIQRFPTIANQLLDIEVIRLRWPACKLWNIAPLFSSDKNPAQVEVISGACTMLKRYVFEQIGMFSEEYFMYADDMELCYKAKRAGYTNYYVGDAVLVHHGGGSSKQREVRQWATIMKFKAMMHFCSKTRGPGYAFLFRLSMGCAALIRLMAVFILSTVGSKLVHRKNALSKWTAVLKWSTGRHGSELTTAGESHS